MGLALGDGSKERESEKKEKEKEKVRGFGPWGCRPLPFWQEPPLFSLSLSLFPYSFINFFF
jgi:hypothetical protein